MEKNVYFTRKIPSSEEDSLPSQRKELQEKKRAGKDAGGKEVTVPHRFGVEFSSLEDQNAVCHEENRHRREKTQQPHTTIASHI